MTNTRVRCDWCAGIIEGYSLNNHAFTPEERAQHHEKFRVVIGRSQYKLCSEPCREKMREYHEEGNR